MKKLFFLLCLLIISGGIFAQTGGCIKKPVTYQDTTINKAFFKYEWSYDGSTKIIRVRILGYISRGAMRTSANYSVFPEIPAYIDIDTQTDQNKTLSDLDLYVRNGIRAKLKELNPSWTNTDFEWYN